MTEPEELDEDLFADLYVNLSYIMGIAAFKEVISFNNCLRLISFLSYDGDEAAANPVHPTEVHAVPEVPTSSVKVEDSVRSDHPMQEANTELRQNLPEQNVPEANSGDAGGSGFGWQNGNVKDEGGNDYGHMAVEQESQGVGIKEDG